MRALVTGCSSGIGRATAQELARRGHDVVATARKVETLDDLDVAARLALDVDDDESVRAAFAAAGPLDALVNNAGYGKHAPVETIPIDVMRAIFETNVLGAVRCIQAALPAMIDRGAGVIVNVSSLAGRVSPPLSAPYSASKFALEAVSESLKFEAGHFGVRVVVIEPGVIDTRFEEVAEHLGIIERWRDLEVEWRAAQTRLSSPDGTKPGADLVANAIADAIEQPGTPLRVPVGADAQTVTAVRRSTDDAAFETAMRETLDFRW